MLSKKKVRHPIFFFALPLATLASLSYLTIARAQITPDNSLGAENSVVAPNVDIKGIPSDRIDGGAIRGDNLFHSFQEFNINAGRGAYFSNPQGIANILTRVTGGNVSNIQGILGVLGNANLFLINPNGILFGPNARLDVGGSFLGSTANSLIFKNNFEFSATNPQAPPLLTINVPIGLGFRNNPGNITNQSNQPTIVDNSGNPIGLTVPSGNSLALVGGDINSDDGRITVPGGRVELGGLAGAGTVGLDVSGNTFKLNFPNDSLLSNITLANDARVAVRGNGGGDIVVNANTFTATNGGRLTAGTEGVGNAGDITVNVNNFNISGIGLSQTESGVYNQTIDGASGNAGNIFINSKSFNASSNAVVRSRVLAGSQGDGGNINITTGSFSLTDGALLSASTYGEGNAGNVSVRANDSVSLVNANIFSTVEAGGEGKGGNIDIKAATVSLKDGAQLLTVVRQKSGDQPAGRGDAGNVSVSVTGPVTITGVKDGFASAIFSDVETGAVGNGGNITISSGSLSLSDGALLQASTSGQGNAGNVSVRALGGVELVDAYIFSTVEAGGVGKGGNIDIKAGTLSLKDGAQLLTSVREASSPQPAGKGDAGNVSVSVTGPVTITGVKDGFASAIFSDVETGAVGNGGNITISSGSLSLSDGALLQASTSGQGNAGNVSVRALGGVELVDAYIFSTVEAGGVGKGGNIDIKAGTLSLKDGAQLLTSVREASSPQPAGKGDAGNVSVSVTGPVTITGVKDGFASAIFSDVETGAVGNGGNITISSGSLSLSDGALLQASTSGQGNAGNVSVRALGGVELVDAYIFSTVEAGGVGKGGNIDIKAGTLSLKDGAQLLTSVREASSPQPAGKGDAGNVSVSVTGPVTITGVKDGFASAIFSRVNTGATGNGGNIAISSGSFSLSDGALLEASTYGQGNAGNVSVRASGSVELVNQGILSTVESTGVGNGGNININAATLSLKDGAQLAAGVRGQASDTQPGGRGNAGNVTVDVTGPVMITGVGRFSSGIFNYVETGAIGNAGNIAISSGSFSLTNGGILNSSTLGQGNAGNVSVRASGAVELAGSDTRILSTVEAGGVGKGGNIDIKAATLSLKDGAQLRTAVRQASDTQPAGRGDAGNVSVSVTGPVTIAGIKDGFYSGVFSFAQTGTTGNGGNITISSGSFSLSDSGRLSASTAGQGNAGNVSVRASGAVELTGSDTRIFSTVEAGGEGKGGNIDIKAATLSLKDGAQLRTLVSEASDTQPAGRGDAGNVTVDVTGPVTIAGEKDGFYSGIFSFVNTGAKGNGGNIAITSGSFSLSDTGRLIASTYGQGNAGNVSVRASDFVSLAGSNTGIASTVEPQGVGKGGNISINARRVSLNDGAQITASSFGNNSAAGDIEVDARSIRLDNGSTINADTVGGQGNINLRARDYVLLRRGSKITTNATGLATGGNITINAGNLVAFPSENSDITAKAQQSSGGRITINTKGGIFGIEYRQQETPLSDITASSDLGLQFSGVVQINTPDIDPTRGLFELTEAVVDPAQQVAQNPCTKGYGSSFTITGRGGLPTDPNKILSSDNVRVDLIKPVVLTVGSTNATQKQPSQKPPVKQIIPAQGWIYNEKGQVVLVGYDPTKTGPQREQPAPTSSCAAVK
ncbi:filamentous hemagglutinin [Brasilonema octagenarum UFV-E1]|nr:filamentous hemagglutinin [Brasilonema octagenarum UFV-E1]